MEENAAAPATSTSVIHPQPSPDYTDNTSSHDSDDEPMVYVTPRDYATLARQNRDRLIAEGADPGTVILQSEVENHIPRREGESIGDFTKRYAETMKSMIRGGVSILNDWCTADVVPSGFGIPGGRMFDLGPATGVTKGEYREFSQWHSTVSEAGQMQEVPEKWLKFETRADAV